MKNAKWKDDFSAIDEFSTCKTSQNFSKAYLRHLFASKELLAAQMATLHNLSFYLWLVNEARNHIEAGDFGTWKNEMVVKLKQRL
jgi:queuine tRNA-ribosyltransferase